MNIILFLGALLGLSSVMMAAYVDHVLGLTLSGRALSGLLTAVRYHQLYAIVISIIGLYCSQVSNHKVKSWLILSAYIFSMGIWVFSGSIYFSVILKAPGITFVTPSGGVLLMLGWACLVRVSLFRFKNNG
jgi:uncharacterized membrane protein YgdD (TMEM256/DUF423 family)